MRWKRLLGIFVLCMLLAGCTASPPSAPAATAMVEMPVQTEPLVILTVGADSFRTCAQAFTEQTGVELRFPEASNAAFEQMLVDLAAGKSTYDIVDVDNALGSLYTMDSLLDKGYFLPLTEASSVEKAVGAMLPLLQQLVTREGTIYALPHFVRFKVLGYRSELYEALETGKLQQYNRGALSPVMDSQLEQIPPQQEFASWEELLKSGFLDAQSGELACNAMLEQYMLRCQQEGFTFDSREFVHTLEQMKAGKLAAGGAPGDALYLGIGGVARMTQGEADGGDESDWRIECDAYYPIPTLDGQAGIPMSYGVLAINAFTDQAEDALRFLDIAAERGLRGAQEEDPMDFDNRYGMPETAACYTDEAHLLISTGMDPENQARWRAMQERLEPIQDAGFLTSFYVEIFPQYLDGAISAKQCAAMTQERYRMYKLEQGE